MAYAKKYYVCHCGGSKQPFQAVCADCWGRTPQHLRSKFLQARGMRNQLAAAGEITDFHKTQDGTLRRLIV